MLALGANEVYTCVGIAASPGSKSIQPLSHPVGSWTGQSTQAGHHTSPSAPHQTWSCAGAPVFSRWALEGELGTEHVSHPAWHPSGAPTADSVFTKVQKEIAERCGITFTAPPLGRSLQGIIMDKPRPNNFILCLQQRWGKWMVLRERYFKFWQIV